MTKTLPTPAAARTANPPTSRAGIPPATSWPFITRFVLEYTRNPVNLLLLAIVPVVFVVVVAGSMADAAKLLDGVGGPAVETASAGWAAGFLAGIAMYFQTAATRETDRRLVLAGLPASTLVLARVLTGVAIAAGASLAALAARTGLDAPGRVVAGTLMFAVIYVAIGAVVAALAADSVNGTMVVLFVWILDVFFGPAMGAADRPATRALPTHFVTMWMADVPGQHGGRVSDLGWALTSTAVAVVVAWVVAAGRTRVPNRTRPEAPGRPVGDQFRAAARAGWRQARRNPTQWVLFVVVPVVFILTADSVTPDQPIVLTLREHGERLTATFAMPAVHGATMAPIAVASLAALIGLHAMVDSHADDQRAALAGLRPSATLAARVVVLAVMVLVATAVSLATTALVFHAERWVTYAAANVLLALTYGLIGALLAPIFGRVGGAFIAFLLPFLDIGITQSPMLHPEPTTLSRLLPGYGGSRVLLDGALTRGFDEPVALLVGLGWLVALAVLLAVAYWQGVAVHRQRR